MRELLSKLQGDEIRFVSIGSFEGKVLYVQPVLNAYLHHLSQILTQKLKQIPETILRTNYQPFSWLPHCTIAKQLSKEQMMEAYRVLNEEFVVTDAKVTRIGVAKTNPHRDLAVWNL